METKGPLERLAGYERVLAFVVIGGFVIGLVLSFTNIPVVPWLLLSAAGCAILALFISYPIRMAAIAIIEANQKQPADTE